MDQKGRISKRLLFEFWCLDELPLEAVYGYIHGSQ